MRKPMNMTLLRLCHFLVIAIAAVLCSCTDYHEELELKQDFSGTLWVRFGEYRRQPGPNPWYASGRTSQPVSVPSVNSTPER
jgi:hypothetical protein